jgi:hypothetical protein
MARVEEETAMIAMNEKKAVALLAAVVALGVIGTVSAAQAQYNYNRKGGFVIPCSLAGVNPAFHPDIFSDPFLAREYGFIRSRNGTWQVERNCVRGPYHN